MECSAPRILLAGTNSGCGKTTLTCAVLQALVNRGLRTGAFKCGPDYIDPMFHSRVIGAHSANLDLFFFSPNTLNYLLAANSQGCDVSIVEGVMGFYDGLSLTSTQASSYAVAKETRTPVVLTVNARGAAFSVLATIQGFLALEPDSGIRGVILNQCSPMSYPALARAIRERFGEKVVPLGYLPPMKECALESRHLGLVTAQEVEDLKQKLNLLAAQAEKSLDLEGLLTLARSAPPLSFEPVNLPRQEPVRIAVAMDKAFCFYYGDNLRALEERSWGRSWCISAPLPTKGCRKTARDCIWAGAIRNCIPGSWEKTGPCWNPSEPPWRRACPASPSAADSCI